MENSPSRMKKGRPAARPRRTIVTRSAAETIAAAKDLARGFKGDEVVFLIGELGAGKTVFAKGLAAGLGLKNIHRVCSPTFTIMNVYPARVPIYHFDLYRLGKAAEIRDLGFEDFVGEGVVIVEWAERMADAYPAIKVLIEVGADDRRTIHIHRGRGFQPRKAVDHRLSRNSTKIANRAKEKKR
jgi:tRNA threonylcarbamoyladenosine biosynthesis protein TsaE